MYVEHYLSFLKSSAVMLKKLNKTENKVEL